MKRYTITVVPPFGSSIDLLIPCDRNSTITDLKAITFARAKKRLNNLPPDDKAELHLHTASGPLLDAEDIIHHIILAPAAESISVTFRSPNVSSLVGQVSRLRELSVTCTDLLEAKPPNNRFSKLGVKWSS